MLLKIGGDPKGRLDLNVKAVLLINNDDEMRVNMYHIHFCKLASIASHLTLRDNKTLSGNDYINSFDGLTLLCGP